MKLTIIGTGYVGLISGVCFAELGHHVICSDIDSRKIAQLKQGIAVLHEEKLENLLVKNIKTGHLSFGDTPQQDVIDADVVFMAVGTPERPQDGRADLTALFNAYQSIATQLKPQAVVVNKSTVPVGTALQINEMLLKIRKNNDCFVVSNPEFLREGRAIDDFMNPDRIVIGCEAEAPRKIMREVYEPLTNQGFKLIEASWETAELIKYAANAFLAVKIAFINEIADLCEQTRSDVHEVSTAIGLDHRIGSSGLVAGPGYGGSCFPKDTKALLEVARDKRVDLRVVEASITANIARKRALAERACIYLETPVDKATIAILGLAFKANTDDIRESPALDLIERLSLMGAHLNITDPQAIETGREALHKTNTHMAHVSFYQQPEKALENANMAIVITEWQDFTQIDWKLAKESMNNPIIFDMRGILDQNDLLALGYKYYRLGKANLHGTSISS